jgi:hypothetical protein
VIEAASNTPSLSARLTTFFLFFPFFLKTPREIEGVMNAPAYLAASLAQRLGADTR